MEVWVTSVLQLLYLTTVHQDRMPILPSESEVRYLHYSYKFSWVRNFAVINFRDQVKFRLNFLIFIRILIFFFLLILINIKRVASKVQFRGYKL